MAVSLKTDLRFPESGQHGHGSRIIQLLNRARVKATVLIEVGRLYITDVDKYKTVVVNIPVDAIQDISKKEYSNTIKEVFFIVANDIRYKILIEE